MPKIAALGGLSSRGFGEFAQQTAAAYIEDVFSTYLYTGNSGTQTVDNGIDLSGKGGLVWVKGRNRGSNHALLDSSRGNNYLVSNLTDAQTNLSDFSTTFTQLSNGFRFVGDGGGLVNENTYTYASWTFRKQPKFFDVVTYTGNGVNGRQINHSLGSVPGMIIVKATSVSGDNWPVWHRSFNSGTGNGYAWLNSSGAASSFGGAYWGTGGVNFVAPTSTTFTISDDGGVNANGVSYVAYLFAHNAGGFGADGSQNVISCGGYTGNTSSQQVINLGYEPQFVIIKNISTTSNWNMQDTMREMSQTNEVYLLPNTSGAEVSNAAPIVIPTATGFTVESGGYTGWNQTGYSYIYMAIRRGPMRTPTDATKVYAPVAYTATNVDGRLISSGFPVDSAIIDPRNGYSTPGGPNWFSRLTGNGYFLQTAQTAAELNGNSNSNGIMGQDGITVSRNGTNVWSNVGSNTYISWFLARAPGFFDVVCYTGNGASTQTINHNLGVVPEMMIVKRRDVSGYQWGVYNSAYGPGQWTLLNSTASASVDNGIWGGVSPTATQFTVGNYADVNASGSPYVCYLFASCSGVSKVGTYTGNGTAPQTINCGFTAGARFVLIKLWDQVGGWYVYDTARGMSSGNDPYLLLNSSSAEVTNTDNVDTTPSGFIVNNPSILNVGGWAYIYLAIA